MKRLLYSALLALLLSCSDSNTAPVLPLEFQGFDGSRMLVVTPLGALKIKLNQSVNWRSTGGTVAQGQNDTLTYTAPATAGFQQVVIKRPGNSADSLVLNIAVTPSAALFKLLQGGNHSLIFRHAAADVGADQLSSSTIPDWWKSCDSKLARQLNSQGLSDAAAIGKTLKRLQLPVGRLISSEYCRAFTSAEKLETGLPIQQVKELNLSVSDETKRCENTLKLAANQPLDAKNTVFITHTGLLASQSDCNALNQLQWGDAAVFSVKADKTISFMGFIRVKDWTDLGK
ncbi:histidine phosphatase family protein [Spirosoma areae]